MQMPETRNGTYKQWQSYWWIGPQRQSLWTRYNGNFKAYSASYRPNAQKVLKNQEDGMGAFIRMEARLLRTMRYAPYEATGRSVADSIVRALVSPTTNDRVDCDLVLIDFEGDACKGAMKEFGVAVLNTASILEHAAGSVDADCIATTNYALANHRQRSFMFGRTTRIDPSHFCGTVKHELRDGEPASSPRRIILVAHGIGGDLATLEKHGIRIEDLPAVAGIIDTGKLWEELKGEHGSLECLLERFGIPWRTHSLHCAGNDANYTMRALLALVHARISLEGLTAPVLERFGALKRIARAPLLVWPPPREDVDDVWDWPEDAMLETSLFE